MSVGYEILSAFAALLFILLIPGWALYSFIGSRHRLLRTRLTIQLGLGFLILLIVGIGLSSIGRIDSTSLYVIYGTIGVISVVAVVRNRRNRERRSWRNLLSIKVGLRSALVIAPFILAVILWFGYLGTHTADAGTHAFWSRWLISTGRLPDYSLGTAVQPQILVFGPHLLLGSLSLISLAPVITIFWIPLLFLYLAILLAIQSITLQITKSETASTFASLFYVFAQIPAARIFLGNLSDLIGYFILYAIIAAVLALLGKFGTRQALPVALLVASLIGYYQYALVVGVFIVLFLGLFYVAKYISKTGLRLPKPRSLSWLVVPISLAVILSLILALHVTYISFRSVEILQGSRWPPLDLAGYLRSIGNINLLILGIPGILLLTVRGLRSNSREFYGGIVLTAWVLALVGASLGPFFGIGIEPVRFIWRLIDPLAVAAGVFLFSIVVPASSRMIGKPGFLQPESKAAPHASRRAIVAMTGLSVVLAAAFIVVPFQPSWPGWQPFPEPFYQDDVAVGAWLSEHADIGDGIAVSLHVDQTGTWIQASSVRPRFFYRADFAISVGEPEVVRLYTDIATLFTEPFSPSSLEVTQKYNISYVVLHAQEIAAFAQSPFFREVHRVGEAAIFEPIYPAN